MHLLLLLQLERIARVDVAIGVRAGRRGLALLIGDEQAIAGVAPLAALQTVALIGPDLDWGLDLGLDLSQDLSLRLRREGDGGKPRSCLLGGGGAWSL